MSRYKIYNGYIFRIKESGAKDKVISVLTRNGDRVSFLAKGVKSAKSKKSASIEFGNLVKIKAITGYSIPILTEISIINEHRAWKEDAETMMIYQALLELLEKSTIEGGNDVVVFSLITFLITHGSNSPIYSLSVFIVKMLELHGILPDLSKCIQTGEDVSSKNATYSLHLVGFLSQKSKVESSKVDELAYKIIRYIEETPLENMYSLSVSPTDAKKTLKILLHWFELAFETNLKSKKVLFSILKM